METSVSIGNVVVSTSVNKVDRSVSWMHPGSSYILESLKLRFSMDTGSGYCVRVYEPADNTQRAYVMEAVNSGVTVEVPLETGAWEGKQSGSLTVQFYKRGTQQASYVGAALVLTYRAKAVASTVTVVRTMAGQPQTVQITNTDPDVTHTVRWEYASGSVDSGVQTYGAATRNPAWAVPQADLPTLYAANLASATEIGQVTVQTYLDGDPIGQPVTAVAFLDLPETDDTRPVILTVTASDTHDSAAQAIGTQTGNQYVRGHSTIQRTVTAQGYPPACQIARIELVTPDGTVTGANSSTLQRLIRTAGTYPITVRAVDARGFAQEYSLTALTVQDYTDPAITGAQAVRCDQNGTATDGGTYAWVEATAVPAGVTYTAKIYVKGGSQIGSSETLTGGSGVIGGNLDEDTSYEIVITATDGYGVEGSAVVEIPTATITMCRLVGGKGVSFGMAARRKGVEIAEDWPLYVHGEEIERLILDMAHPAGSTIETLDANFDPNKRWPWTRWAQSNGKWVRGV